LVIIFLGRTVIALEGCQLPFRELLHAFKNLQLQMLFGLIIRSLNECQTLLLY